MKSVFDLQIWYAIPLIVSISLVYGATRHEALVPILKHSLRAAIWVAGFMGVIFGILAIAGWNL